MHTKETNEEKREGTKKEKRKKNFARMNLLAKGVGLASRRVLRIAGDEALPLLIERADELV